MFARESIDGYAFGFALLAERAAIDALMVKVMVMVMVMVVVVVVVMVVVVVVMVVVVVVGHV